jgi:hypothetical protein
MVQQEEAIQALVALIDQVNSLVGNRGDTTYLRWSVTGGRMTLKPTACGPLAVATRLVRGHTDLVVAAELFATPPGDPRAPEAHCLASPPTPRRMFNAATLSGD